MPREMVAKYGWSRISIIVEIKSWWQKIQWYTSKTPDKRLECIFPGRHIFSIQKYFSTTPTKSLKIVSNLKIIKWQKYFSTLTVKFWKTYGKSKIYENYRNIFLRPHRIFENCIEKIKVLIIQKYFSTLPNKFLKMIEKNKMVVKKTEIFFHEPRFKNVWQKKLKRLKIVFKKLERIFFKTQKKEIRNFNIDVFLYQNSAKIPASRRK